MERVVSATEARIRFGEMMRRVVEKRERIVVERGGTPYVVLLSYEEYKRLREQGAQTSWEQRLDEVLRLGSRIQTRRKGQPLTPPEEIIRRTREERDERLTGLR